MGKNAGRPALRQIGPRRFGRSGEQPVDLSFVRPQEGAAQIRGRVIVADQPFCAAEPDLLGEPELGLISEEIEYDEQRLFPSGADVGEDALILLPDQAEPGVTGYVMLAAKRDQLPIVVEDRIRSFTACSALMSG